MSRGSLSFSTFLKNELIPMYISISTANISAFNIVSYCFFAKGICESIILIREILFLRTTQIKPFGKINFLNFVHSPSRESFFDKHFLFQNNSILKKNKCTFFIRKRFFASASISLT